MSKEGRDPEINALYTGTRLPDYVVRAAYKVGSPHRYEAESFEVHLRPIWEAEIRVRQALQFLQASPPSRLIHVQEHRDYLKVQLHRQEDTVKRLQSELGRRHHRTVKRFSAVGILSLTFCLALYFSTGILVVNPLFSLFGILALTVFGLMAVVDERRSKGNLW